MQTFFIKNYKMEDTFLNLTKVDPRYSDIPDKFYINDLRKLTDFKKHTFLGYQKSDVLAALQKSILEQKLEEACHWGVELMTSGNLMDCWDRLILINSKLINYANPNLSFYLWLVGEARKHIIAGDYSSWKVDMIQQVKTRL